MQATTVATSSRNELVVATTEELEPIREGTKLAIVVVVVIVNTYVKGLKEHAIPEPIPLVILEIGVGVKVTLINTITHVSKVFKTLNIVLNNAHVVERPWFQLVPLTKPIDTTNEQLVNDLNARVKHVVLGDWFQRRNLVFKGG